jgi:hypothetical protein
MKLYRCKTFYASGLMDEPAPHWPQDYDFMGEMSQQGEGNEALEHAFGQCHAEGKDMKPGDVVGLDDGSLHRCEASGWTDIGKTWQARIQHGQGRAK